MKQRQYIIIVAIFLLALVGLAVYQLMKNKNTKESYCGASKVSNVDYELVDDNYGSAPSVEKLSGMDGAKCKIGEGELLGYKYQIPEPLPSVEDLLPEEACDSYYDPEAADAAHYIFNFPLNGSVIKTRAEQAGDIWRGDLNIESRPQECDFVSIHHSGDQLLHGAFSDYTKKTHEIVACKNETWVRDAPIHVANGELIMDY